MLGINFWSFRRWAEQLRKKMDFPLDVLAVLERVKELGLEGYEIYTTAQMRGLDEEHLRAIRRKAEELGLCLQFSVVRPADPSFEKMVVAASTMGAGVVKTVLGMCSRPKIIKTYEDARANVRRYKSELMEAEKIGRIYGMRIAVETHLTLTADEWIEVMEYAGSEYLGICLDTANCFWTAEDPVEVAQKLAPYTNSTHLKDGRLKWTGEEFQVDCGIPLGQGHVNLPMIVGILKRARPDLAHTIECVTGMPFLLPWLDDVFWNTFKQRDARDLVKMLKFIRDTPQTGWEPVPDMNSMSVEQQIEYEFSCVKKSVSYARERLNL